MANKADNMVNVEATKPQPYNHRGTSFVHHIYVIYTWVIYKLFSNLPITRRFNLADPPSTKVALSGSVIMSHSYDYISLFVSFVDIPVGFDNLFKRIASINDRSYLTRFNEFFEVN